MSKVYLKSCRTYNEDQVRETISGIMESMGGIDRFIKPGMKVILKPNMILAKKPQDAATTHPAVVAAVASLVRNAGAVPIIAESSFGQYTKASLDRHYASCGYKKLAEDGLVELNNDVSVTEIQFDQGKNLKKLSILKPILDADFVISLSKLKTHALMTYTGAVKNLFGSVAGFQKGIVHARFPDSKTFADAIIDICLAVKPGLHIMDAVTGMEGDGPTAGTPRDIGFIGASTDPFALDFAAASVITGKPETIPTIAGAISRNLSPSRPDQIEFPLENPEAFKIIDFRLPGFNSSHTVSWLRNSRFLKPYPAFNSKVCVGCGECSKNCPVSALTMVEKRPVLNMKKCIRCFCCHEGCMPKAVMIKRNRFAGMFEAGLSVLAQMGGEIFRHGRKK